MSPTSSNFANDPMSDLTAEVRKVQPYQATKIYLCPGCNNEIGIRIGHVVVVPLGRPEDRRHWHSSCWDRRTSRRRER